MLIVTQRQLFLSQSCQNLYDFLGDDVWEAELERKFGGAWYELFEHFFKLSEMSDNDVIVEKAKIFADANEVMFGGRYDMGTTPENVFISKILRKTINMAWNCVRKGVDNPWVVAGKKVCSIFRRVDHPL